MGTKDAGLRIRVDRGLRESFQRACEAENRCASEVLRDFMRVFVERNPSGAQADLFVSAPSKNRELSS